MFIVTEYVEGETLREQIKRGIKLNEALDLIIQIASGVATAHAVGIVHRDLKPENIMIRSDGYAKVLDFGLAKLSEKRISDLSMPPESAMKTATGVGVSQ